MSWVKFHATLNQGDKRSIPRAARYIYMELSLMAREYSGLVPIAKRLDIVDAIHDVLGGSRPEIEHAIPFLFEAEHGDEPMCSIVQDANKRFVCINAWSNWNRFDDSSERVKKFRQNQKKETLSDGVASKADESVTREIVTRSSSSSNDRVTRYNRYNSEHVTRDNLVTHLAASHEPHHSGDNLKVESLENKSFHGSEPVTRFSNGCNALRDRYGNDGNEDVTLLDKRREEKKRDPSPPLPPHPSQAGLPEATGELHEPANLKPDEKQRAGQGSGGGLAEYFKSFPYLTEQDAEKLAVLSANRKPSMPLLDDVVAASIAQLHKAQAKTFVQSPSGWLRNKIEQLLRLNATQFKDLVDAGKPKADANPDAVLLADINQSEALLARQSAEHAKKRLLEQEQNDPKKLASLVANSLQNSFSRPGFAKAVPRVTQLPVGMSSLKAGVS